MLKLEDSSFKSFIKFLNNLDPFSVKRIVLSYYVMFYVWLLYYCLQAINFHYFLQDYSIWHLLLSVNAFKWFTIIFFIFLPILSFLIAKHYQLVNQNKANTLVLSYSIGFILSLWMIVIDNSIYFLSNSQSDYPDSMQFYYNQVFSFLLPQLFIASFFLFSAIIIIFVIHHFNRKNLLDPFQQ